jgi:hypothetical protein
VRLDFDRLFTLLGQRRDLCAQRVAAACVDVHAHAGEAFGNDVDATVGRLGHLSDHANRADTLQVLGGGLVGVVFLEHQQNQPVGGERAVDAFKRHWPIDG